MIKFRTNIDCCKQFVNTLQELASSPITPLIGDHIEVHNRGSLTVVLRVAGRKWSKKFDGTLQLECELSLTHDWNIVTFEKMLRMHNVTW